MLARACVRTLLLSLSLGLGVAHAQSKPVDPATRAAARDLGSAGVKAYQDGDYATASEKLEKAYALLPMPSLGLWSARALAKQNKLVAASERYLEVGRLEVSGGDAEVQNQAKKDAAKEAAEIAPRIPSVIVQLRGANPDEVQVTLDNNVLPSALIGERRPTDPGVHRVTGRRGDAVVESQVNVTAGQTAVAVLNFTGQASAVPPTGTPPATGAPPEGTEPVTGQPGYDPNAQYQGQPQYGYQQPAPAVPKDLGIKGQLRFGLRLGVALPFGSTGNIGPAYTNQSMDSYVTRAVPIWLDLDYGLSRTFALGVSLAYAPLTLKPCVNCDDNSGGQVRFNVHGQVHLAPSSFVSPWFGFGVGYEYEFTSYDYGAETDTHSNAGFEYLSLHAGLDFRIVDAVQIAPFTSISFAQFADWSDDTEGLSTSGAVTDPRFHEWVMLGIKGTFNIKTRKK